MLNPSTSRSWTYDRRVRKVDRMRTAQLGPMTTGAPGFGCMGLSQGYGATDDDESVRALRCAVDTGVRLFDTAMSYGQGHNERLVGRALGAADVQIATKFGIVRSDAGVRVDARPEHVRGYCEQSLARLGRDVIDLYYLHRVDPDVPIGATVAAMAELVAGGTVRHLGVSEVTAEQLRAACAVHPIAAVQVEWSLLWREPEDDLVPTARELGVGVVAYSPLGRGLLTATLTPDGIDASDFRRGDPRFHGAELAANLRQIAALGAFADDRGITAGQLALAWLLARGPDVVPIPGTRNPARVAENAAAADVTLSTDDLALLETLVPRAGWAGDRQSFAAPVTTRR
jgi:aryl-alcohol dehydrogenase-like predicted oxidoreductase